VSLAARRRPFTPSRNSPDVRYDCRRILHFGQRFPTLLWTSWNLAPFCAVCKGSRICLHCRWWRCGDCNPVWISRTSPKDLFLRVSWRLSHGMRTQVSASSRITRPVGRSSRCWRWGRPPPRTSNLSSLSRPFRRLGILGGLWRFRYRRKGSWVRGHRVALMPVWKRWWFCLRGRLRTIFRLWDRYRCRPLNGREHHTSECWWWGLSLIWRLGSWRCRRKDCRPNAVFFFVCRVAP